MKKNNKRNLKQVITLLLIIGLCISIWQLYVNYKVSFVREKNQSSIPEFAFSDLEGNIVTKKDLPENNAVCFLSIDLDCNLCETLLEDIKIANNKIDHSFFIVVANGKKQDLLFLQKEMKVNYMDEVRITHDPENNFEEIFGSHPKPFLVAYDTHGSLIKRYTVPIKLTNVLKDIQKSKSSNP